MTEKHFNEFIAFADSGPLTRNDSSGTSNHAPFAPELASTTTEHAPVTLDPLHGAMDEDGESLTITSVSPSSDDISITITDDQKLLVAYTGPNLYPHVHLSRESDGPAISFQFEYTISDGTADATGLVSVLVFAEFEPGELITGKKTADTLTGSAIKQFIYGAAGNDILYGRGGDDFLSGNRGNDILVGGAGADAFVFSKERGHDIVRDFDRSEGDVIDMNFFNRGASIEPDNIHFYSFKAIMSHAVDVGHNVVIAMDDHHSLEIKNMHVDDLKRSDVISDVTW